MSARTVALSLVVSLILVSAASECPAQSRGTGIGSLSRSKSGSSIVSSGSSRSTSGRTVSRSAPSIRASVSSISRSTSRSGAPSMPKSTGRTYSVTRPRGVQRPSSPRSPSRSSMSLTPPAPARVAPVRAPYRSSRPQQIRTVRPTAPSLPSVSIDRGSVVVPDVSRMRLPQSPQTIERPTIKPPSVGINTSRMRSISGTAGSSSSEGAGTADTPGTDTSTPSVRRLQWRGVFEPGTSAISSVERPTVASGSREITAQTISADASRDGLTGIEDIYPRRKIGEDSEPREPKVTVIGNRAHRSTPFPRTLGSAESSGDSPTTGSGRLRRPPPIARNTARPEVGQGPPDRNGRETIMWPPYRRELLCARRQWVRDLRHRHNKWWISFGLGWGTPYVWEPYWYPYRPYIGRWQGYRGWYHCTPYTTGIWWPWHRRVLLGYVYDPYIRHAPYSTTVWVGYDPFLYFWWPAPYSVSVNYYTYEYGNYPPDSTTGWSSNDWVYYEPSPEPPAEIEMPFYAERYAPEETRIAEREQLPAEREPVAVEPAPVEVVQMPVEQPESTPPGVVEAATVPAQEPVEVEPAPEAAPQVVPEAVVPGPEVEPAAPPPLDRSISVPAPGRSSGYHTILAAGGTAFLGLALWMAWPRP